MRRDKGHHRPGRPVLGRERAVCAHAIVCVDQWCRGPQLRLLRGATWRMAIIGNEQPRTAQTVIISTLVTDRGWEP
jgi:hypothetical protein